MFAICFGEAQTLQTAQVEAEGSITTFQVLILAKFTQRKMSKFIMGPQVIYSYGRQHLK